MSENALEVKKDESRIMITARDLARRLKFMIVNGNKLSDQEVFALAQFSAANGLNPFANEAYYMPGVGPIAGIVGYRKIANDCIFQEALKWALKEPQSYWIDARAATHDEACFDEAKGDIAIHATLRTSIDNRVWRRAYLDMARELRELGSSDALEEAKKFVGPEPVWTGVGVVHGSESFAKDGKPEKFDRVERATKRAEKQATKKRFPSLEKLDHSQEDAEDSISVTFKEVEENKQLSQEQPRSEQQILSDFGYTPEQERTISEQQPSLLGDS
jgi:hypothetical protein